MALTLGDNFSYQGSKPLDGRLKYDTLAAMKAVADATMYDGCMAYCSATDKTYQWKSTNTVDADTGKWREFSSGSGGEGGGHTIEDSEGTDLTQRDTLQFGGGFLAEDDDTNEKTVISPDKMQSGDMDDVITPLPSVRPSRSTIVKQVLAIGDTAITFNDIPTTGDYIVNFYNSLGIGYSAITPSSGSVTLTFPAQSANVDVYCEIREV